MGQISSIKIFKDEDNNSNLRDSNNSNGSQNNCTLNKKKEFNL